jgi:Reverse transcriptase (RNA-dependent DNA polymerase)
MYHNKDVQGAFLIGRFGDEKHFSIKVPQGFQSKHERGAILKLNQTIYGLKQVASTFWSELLKTFYEIGFQRSDADPCMYFKFKDDGLILCLLWVNGCLIVRKGSG